MALVLPPNEILQSRPIPLVDDQGGYRTNNWKQTVCIEGEGVFAHYHDHPFPIKGHPYPEACEANNLVKKFTISTLMSLVSPEAILPTLGFALLPYKRKINWLEKILTNYCNTVDYTLRRTYIKRRFYNKFSRELWGFTSHFLYNLGISFELADRCGHIVAHMFEFEDAYRYRGEDIFSEMSKGALMINPRKEILRVMEIYKQREKVGIAEKFVAVGRFITLVLYHPKIKSAFLKAFRATKIDNLRLDEADQYFCRQRGDYDFMGKDDGQRRAEFIELYNGYAMKRFMDNAKKEIKDPKMLENIENQLTNYLKVQTN